MGAIVFKEGGYPKSKLIVLWTASIFNMNPVFKSYLIMLITGVITTQVYDSKFWLLWTEIEITPLKWSAHVCSYNYLKTFVNVCKYFFSWLPILGILYTGLFWGLWVSTTEHQVFFDVHQSVDGNFVLYCHNISWYMQQFYKQHIVFNSVRDRMIWNNDLLTAILDVPLFYLSTCPAICMFLVITSGTQGVTPIVTCTSCVTAKTCKKGTSFMVRCDMHVSRLGYQRHDIRKKSSKIDMLNRQKPLSSLWMPRQRSGIARNGQGRHTPWETSLKVLVALHWLVAMPIYQYLICHNSTQLTAFQVKMNFNVIAIPQCSNTAITPQLHVQWMQCGNATQHNASMNRPSSGHKIDRKKPRLWHPHIF